MNLQLSDIVILLCIMAVVYAWWCNSSIREQALTHAKRHCENLNLQLLEDSVSGSEWKPIWHHGQLRIKRSYKFEFSSSGMARYPGKISYIGSHRLDIWLSPHDF
ncbi:MAG: DUF3301 domain-containing protein [Marinomonas sp.]|jgi:hypothetical protein|uniref:DUF3301 domain-containing protein n=1 Tax=Marinomonas pontica TaxID=264739 RepID=A0ABN6WNQ4_9GAMM|nr:DUF3301 domain-containing protein [Marinomonas pontica]MCW8357344.1 DUF3301 domain-containing protein [Marinomonas pontica]BDX03303.1 hypothetical protein MACH16_20510 [Marinomonas pontica]